MSKHNWHNGARKLAKVLAKNVLCPPDIICPVQNGIKEPSCVACWMRWAQREVNEGKGEVGK